MEQILWLRASCASLSPSEVDAVHHDDEVVALLHPPQRNAICEVDVHAVFGGMQETRGTHRCLFKSLVCLIRAVSLCATHGVCEAFCKLCRPILADICAARASGRARSTRR